MSPVSFPIDFVAIRKALIAQMQSVTKLVAIVEEPTEADAPRPELPYLSMKLTSPSVKSGDDSMQNIGGSKVNIGGVRKMVVSFKAYAVDQEQSYNWLALWQSALEQRAIQAELRKAGIAVWVIGSVADISLLLNTGYEGRSNLDVQFGVAANVTEDLGSIETVQMHSEVEHEKGTDENDSTVP
jgi:hypothetical protein